MTYIAPCDAESVILCVNVRDGYRVWEKVPLSDLPDRLACLDDLERVIIDEIAVTTP